MPNLTDDEIIEDADLPVMSFAHPPSHVEEMRIKPGMTIADFGAGSGAHIFPLAEAVGEAGRVYAIDIQRDLLTRIKNEANRCKHQHVDILWGDLEEPGGSKLGNDFVDLVLVSNLLSQLEDKYAAFNEAQRILKPSGKLVVIDWHGASPESDYAPQIGPHRASVVTKEEAIEIGLNMGYQVVREFDAGSHHYGLIFRAVPRDIPASL